MIYLTALNSLFTVVEPPIGHIVHASDPESIIIAVSEETRDCIIAMSLLKFEKDRHLFNNVGFCRRVENPFTKCLSRQRQFQQQTNYTQNFRLNLFL